MIHKYIVIPKNKKDEANAFCNSIGAEGETFTTPLYKNGEHTHYWTGWLMNEAQYAQIAIKYTQIYDDYLEALEKSGLEIKTESEEL